jgi:hypothetical protein
MQAMPATTTLRRLAEDGPFWIGDHYSFASPHSDEHHEGVIIGVKPVGEKWVEIIVRHSGQEEDED